MKLPDAVYSPQDLSSLIMEVREYTKWFSHVTVKNRRGVKQDTQPPAASAATAELLKTWAGEQPLTDQRLDELINQLQNLSEAAPTVTITLAAPAPEKLKQELTAWCRANLNPGMLVSFRFNATLLGGMVVRYGSRIHDWSFRRQIMEARSKFPEVLRRV